MNSLAAEASVDILVIGAGAAGLAAAMRLEDAVRSGAIASYKLVDAAPQTGGMIRTVEQDGYLLESGPDMFFAEKPEVTEIAGRLGLARELIMTNPLMRRSFLAAGGRLRAMPEGFFMTAPSRLWPFLFSGIAGPGTKLRMAMEPFVPAKKTTEDESVASFVRRRFGAGALRRIAQPMIGGIYAGDPERLSARWAMPKFVEWERRCGSVVRGLKTKGADAALRPGVLSAGPRYSLFQSFRRGMGTLSRAMTNSLNVGHLQMGAAVTRLEAIEGGWSAEVGGRTLRCRSVILALPAPAAARLVRTAVPDLADLLARVRYESCATVQVGWERAKIGHPLNGLGFVAPADDGLPLMAGSFSSVKFEGRAPESKTLLRFFAGGAFGRQWTELSDRELWDAIRPCATELLGLQGEPEFVRVSRHPDSMPQYEVGHDAWAAGIRSAEARVTGLRVCGAMMQGVGVPDTIRDGTAAAEFVLEALKDRVKAANF